MSELMTGNLEKIEQALTVVLQEAPTDSELADVVGVMTRIERMLKAKRASWEKAVFEMAPIPKHDRTRRVERDTRAGTPTAQGQQYELVPQYKTIRSFNTPAILTAIQTVTEWDAWRVLLEASRADAVRFTWRWTDLKTLLHDLNVPLRTGFSEVDDESGTDGPMIGEVKKEAGVKKVAIVERAVVEAVPDPFEPEGGNDE